MKTVSILEYDNEDHQFCPSFVIQDDLKDVDNECAFDEVVIQPSAEWMDDYLDWNRFGRLPDDPAEDLSEEDDPALNSVPTFASLEDLHEFNARGYDLTERLKAELEQGRSPDQKAACVIQVAPYRPLYTNLLVGPVTAWWHVKDCNYGFVVPVQRLPVSDHLKSRLQAFRCHKGMEFWKFNDPETMEQLQEEGRQLQDDLHSELAGELTNPKEQVEEERGGKEEEECTEDTSISSIDAMVEQSCTLVTSLEEKSRRQRVSVQ